MSWSWQFTTAHGEVWQGDTFGEQEFPSQSDAETWLGEYWRDLRDHGVASVTLFEDARQVYGPMSLDPAN